MDQMDQLDQMDQMDQMKEGTMNRTMVEKLITWMMIAIMKKSLGEAKSLGDVQMQLDAIQWWQLPC